MNGLSHEVGNFHRDDSIIYSMLNDVISDQVRRGVALGSIIKGEKVLEELSNYQYPVYGFLHNEVPVIMFMPMDSSEYFANPPIQQTHEDFHKMPDGLFETLISNNCMVISIGLQGEWNIHYKECFVTISQVASMEEENVNYCIDYIISRYDEFAYLTGTFFTRSSLDKTLCGGLQSELNKKLDFNDLEAFYKAVAFLNIVGEVQRCIMFISTNASMLPTFEESIFYKPSFKFKYFCHSSIPVPEPMFGVVDFWGGLYNAKELSSLVYKAYARYCSISPCVGEDSHQLIAKSFCEKVPFYASLHKGDFRRPYEIVEGVYVDGNLSVDRALLKARKAIMDLGLNPYDFKYKYESQNMSLSGLISPFSI